LTVDTPGWAACQADSAPRAWRRSLLRAVVVVTFRVAEKVIWLHKKRMNAQE